MKTGSTAMRSGPLYFRPSILALTPGGTLRRALLILLWAAAAAGAAEPAPVPVPVYGCAIPAPEPLEPRTDVSADIVDVLSGDVEVDLNGPVVFKDRLVLRRSDIQLGADSARYDRDTGEFELSGNIDLRDPDTWLGGDSASYNTESGLFRIDAAEFELYYAAGARVSRRITLEETRILTSTDATYTSCARGKDDWLLRAGSLSIDRETGVGTARNARLEFKGVPILYSPWLTYPVDGQRRSGLLLPDFGSGGQRGVEIAVPYYFNLAPNYDATITPHYMSKRGLQAQGEFRYLSESSEGVLDGEFLPDDDVTGDDRALLHWYNQSQLSDSWRATIDGTQVSDSAYFEDLSTGLGNASQTHLRQRVDFEYFDNTWSALLRLEDYQTLDDSLTDDEQPYQRLPQVRSMATGPTTRWASSTGCNPNSPTSTATPARPACAAISGRRSPCRCALAHCRWIPRPPSTTPPIHSMKRHPAQQSRRAAACRSTASRSAPCSNAPGARTAPGCRPSNRGYSSYMYPSRTRATCRSSTPSSPTSISCSCSAPTAT